MRRYSLIPTFLIFGLIGCSELTTPEEVVEPPVTIQSDTMVILPEPGQATEATKRVNSDTRDRLNLRDQSDIEDARRGLIAFIEDDSIEAADGSIVWQVNQFDFISGDAPDSVNPSLWRQSELAAHHGLFEVTEGLYQVRGYDLAVMSVIEGETGWIVVDPLTTTETAAAALKLVNDTLGYRPVTAMIYTHSHADHFGGARGIISETDIAARNIPVLAPVGFSENAVSENLIAGNHMSRRATLMFGNTIPRSTTAHIGSGLGPGLPNGTISLLLPTEEILGDGSPRLIDGVTFEFIDAGGTEAPAEFMFYLPDMSALCTAEVATATFHNILTPRGAKVRDSLKWSEAIDRVLQDYGDRSDVVFASHHWPTWGSENVRSFLQGQRDIYRYVHDQTLRHANAGADMTRAAEAVAEPDVQLSQFDTRGYYGSLNHNSKAVYQYYFGWWGGNPSEYYALPQTVTASRYVDAIGGAAAVLELAQTAFSTGDYRWSAELLNHLVFAEPDNQDARNWLAANYEQIGFQSESGAWRSYFLTGAAELRRGLLDIGDPAVGNADFLRAVPSLDLFNAMAARFNPDAMTRDPFAVVFRFPDTQEAVTVQVGTAVMVPRNGAIETANADVTIDRGQFDRLMLGQVRPITLILSGELKVRGERAALSDLFDTLDQPEFWFPLVTP